jgi:membrane protein implicated in regulation of membrane protease activity
MNGTLRRYLLFQVPGWIAAAIILAAAYEWGWLPGWGALALVAAWIAKDAVLYPWFGFAYAVEDRTPAERLVGTHGVAVDTLSREGYVKIRGELWRARADPPDAPIEKRQRVVVVGADRMVLVVRAAGQPTEDVG